MDSNDSRRRKRIQEEIDSLEGFLDLPFPHEHDKCKKYEVSECCMWYYMGYLTDEKKNSSELKYKVENQIKKLDKLKKSWEKIYNDLKDY